jgi:hypothetical protein
MKRILILLTVFVLFTITLNSCKKCSKEAGHGDGDDTASDTSSSTDATDSTDSTDQQGSTDTTAPDHLPTSIEIPSVSVEPKTLDVKNDFELVAAPDGEIDPAQWEVAVACVNNQIDELREHRKNAGEQRDTVLKNAKNDALPTDHYTIKGIWDNNVTVAHEESVKAYIIIKGILAMYNNVRLLAEADTSHTADDSKKGIENLKKVVKIAFDEARWTGYAASDAWNNMGDILRNRIKKIHHSPYHDDEHDSYRDEHGSYIFQAVAYKCAIYWVPLSNMYAALPMFENKFNLAVQYRDQPYFLTNKSAGDELINWGNDEVTKVTEAIKDNEFSQLLADSGFGIRPKGR